MDVYLKYALAIIVAKQNLASIDDVTLEMIEAEIEYSMSKAYLYTTDDAKVVDKGRFTYVPKNMLPELLLNYDRIKNNIKIPAHLLIPNLSKKSYLTSLTTGYDALWKGNVGEANFILFNSKSYVSKNGLSGYSIPLFERKLYFLATITPYKACYSNNEGEKCGIFVNIEFPLLVKYLEIFIEHWNNFNQDTYEVDVNKNTKTFYNPQTINFDIKRRFNSNESALIKFQILPFLTKIRTKAYQYDEIELYNRLAYATLYELNADKKNAQQFTLNKHLISFAIDDKITDFVKVMLNSYYQTYRDKKTENPVGYEKNFFGMTYVLLTVFKSPANKDNIKHINLLRLKYTNHNVNYENFIEIMETILKLNNSAELITLVKEVAHSIKKGVWARTHNWAKENPKKDNPKDKREFFDNTIKDLQFTIGAMTNLTSFIQLPTNIRRRIGWGIDCEALLDILILNPTVIKDTKDLLNFYLSQPYKKVVEEAPLDEEVDAVTELI